MMQHIGNAAQLTYVRLAGHSVLRPQFHASVVYTTVLQCTKKAKKRG